MYFGSYETILRDKNRISFPSKLKKLTGNNLMLTNWFENSIMILPKKKWEEIVTKIFENASYLMPEVRDMDRFIYGGTFEIELDREGRFVLPAYLKEYGKIRKEIIFVGGFWYMQMFDKEIFEAHRKMNAIQIRDKAVKVFEATQK